MATDPALVSQAEQDMSGQASRAAITREVAAMNAGALAAFTTRQTLTWLRRRAHSPEDFENLARRSVFGGATVVTDGIGFEARLIKP